MAEEGTLCINADVLKLAGIKASSTSTAEAYTNVYIKIIEGFICSAARYDFKANYSSVSTIGKEILRGMAAAGAASLAGNYDDSNYNSRQSYGFTINLLWAFFQKGITLLEKDNKYKDFILTGTGEID